MKTVSVDKIVEQYEQLRDLVSTKVTDQDNITAINKMLEDFAERIMSAPASGRLNYHNCFVGGFIDHTLRVQDTAFMVRDLLQTRGVEVNATDEEIFLAAVFHDWGKLGTLEEPYYAKQGSTWHQDKLGEYFKHNDKMDYMSVTDRALYTLQSYGITISDQVWKAIKLSDGMFDDGNVGYYKRASDSDNVLHYIIHWADWMSTVAEKQHYVQEKNAPVKPDPEIANLKKSFNELFEGED